MGIPANEYTFEKVNTIHFISQSEMENYNILRDIAN